MRLLTPSPGTPAVAMPNTPTLQDFDTPGRLASIPKEVDDQASIPELHQESDDGMDVNDHSADRTMR